MLKTRPPILLIALLLLGMSAGFVTAQGEDAGAETAEAANPTIDERFDSPRSTMFTYVEAMARVTDSDLGPREQAQARELAMRCFDWSMSGEPNFNNASTLLEVLNKINRVERFQLPGRDEADDRGLSSFVYFPQDRFDHHERVRDDARGATIELTRGDNGEWRFSVGTVAGIQTLRQGLEPLPFVVGNGPLVLTRSQWIRSQVPPSLKSGEFLTLEGWQWIGLFLLIFIGIVLDLTVRRIIAGVWRGVMVRRGKAADRENLKRAVRPFGLIIAALFWYAGLDLIGLPEQALLVIRLAVRFFLMFSAVWAAYRATDLIGELLQSHVEKSATKFDDLLVALVRKSAKVFVTALGLIYIANALNVEILPLLTGLGVGGIAFAFAAKDTIENFFGSVAVVLDRAFEVGDWVVIDSVEGTVEELGLRSTRVRTFYNSLVTVPNSTLVRAKVDNFGRRRYRRFKTHLGVAYDTPPDTIEAFCEGIREIIRRHPYTRKDYFHVWLNSFGPSSLDILLYVFHEAPDWATELRERQRFMLDILRLAERLGVSIAFPTQTLHIESAVGLDGVPRPGDGGRAPGDEQESPERLTEQRSRVMGRRAARDLLQNTHWAGGELPPPVSFGEHAVPDDIPIPPEEHEGEGDDRDSKAPPAG